MAGGENRRFPVNKAFIKINGIPIIEKATGILNECFGNVVISTNSPELYDYLHLPMIGDIVDMKGPLTGIYSCLSNRLCSDIFVTACDMPLIKKDMVELICSFSQNYDVVVPLYGGQSHPLLGVYKKSIIPTAKMMLNEGIRSLRALLSRVHTKFIESKDLLVIENAEECFININTPDDFKKISKSYNLEYE